MATPDPYEIILRQIQSLVELARDKAGNPFSDEEMPEDIEQRLNFLEDYVKKMGEISEQELRDKNISHEELAKILFHDKGRFSRQDKRIIENSLNLNRDLFQMKFALTLANLQANNPEGKHFDKKKTSKTDVNKRKQKFKKAQGNKTWKKL